MRVLRLLRLVRSAIGRYTQATPIEVPMPDAPRSARFVRNASSADRLLKRSFATTRIEVLTVGVRVRHPTVPALLLFLVVGTCSENDDGIDGRATRMRLDSIRLLQTKRYAPDRPIDRQAVQAFIGSLAGQGVTKGIFITTSYFKENALEFGKRGSNTKLVLVNDEQLFRLMMRYHIGVRVERIVELQELDENYYYDEKADHPTDEYSTL